ncbi:MAG: hypothetical protein JETT_0643 [Candidatus Jettenia ecosi]|uniref:Uncharacterized protein n=1 Tax=Candidatus Jettenia ecosi TaxID=2494326 RepID=A0A533QE81_9BACT|nr:MAG: hypothetical protein JETT_0643 [Candidatus Jettenia ecosi]
MVEQVKEFFCSYDIRLGITLYYSKDIDNLRRNTHGHYGKTESM